MLLKFSHMKNNAKLKWLGKDAYSFSTLAGVNCPNAHLCKSHVIETQEGRRIQDGKYTEFRCWAASQEVIFKNLYLQRKHNMETLMKVANSKEDIISLIQRSIPKNAKIIRINLSGDYQNQRIFDAWLEIARANPSIIWYSYTKSLKFWVRRLDSIPENFILTGSLGGSDDHLITEHKLRSVKVVYSEYEARKLGLPIDKDDRYAILNRFRNTNFALVIHNTQPKNSNAAIAWKRQIDGKNKFHGYSSGKTFGKYYKENNHANVTT